MGAVTKQQTKIIRDQISKKLQLGKTHQQIIDELGMDDSTFYRHLKKLRDLETNMWAKIEIDNTKYRALMLLKSFEDTARVCTNIINAERTSNKDRIEACKTRDMAHAHILRLVEQGPMFQHLPEVKIIETRLQQDKIIELQAKSLGLPDELIKEDKPAENQNEEVVE